ncbi:MAG: hypothetical protein K2X08_04155 [Chlamydiales bacterium]|nr:hypothetical protein [Chlamydiales bacterium]
MYEEMVAEGIDVSPGSFSYSSHRAYDELFANEVENFISSRIETIIEGEFECLIVLDDGGKCINYLNKANTISVPVIAIEQTSAGYEAIKSQILQFPVINVARSPVKLILESPMIAQAAAERLYTSLSQKGLCFNEALIIGGGAIGQALKNRLSADIKIVIYDQNISLNESGEPDLSKLLKKFHLIIGCTGKTSIPHEMHCNFLPGSVLVSVSSSDREFDAHYLRKKLPESDFWHQDLTVNEILLVNSGFPVNFDGERENIEPELIQLTIALIAGAIIQARKFSEQLSSGIINLDASIEKQIHDEFTLPLIC